MATKRKTLTNAEKAKRKAKFQSKTIQTNNMINKYRTAYANQMKEREDIYRKARIVDTIYNLNNDLAIEIDGKLQLNMENIIIVDDVLCWKDNKPVVDGYDTIENYIQYDVEFFNNVLNSIGEFKSRTPEYNVEVANIVDE